MKSFKSFLKEETMPFANVRSGGMDIEDSAVRDNINSLLAGMTNGKFVTPYIALERVAKTLANFHIFMPAQSFLEGDSGTVIVPINQYGIKVGMSNAATFISKGEVGKDFTHGPHVEGENNELSNKSEIDPKYTVFFEYRMSDCGMFEIFCEVVDEDELDEILTDLEAELNDETVEEELDEACWDTHKQVGMKKKGGKMVPDCVLKEEEQLDEISDKLKKRYVKKAEPDMKSAERQADFSEYEAKTQASPERKAAFGKEAKELRGIATKRAKGIAMAKKKMEEETINEISDKKKSDYNKAGNKWLDKFQKAPAFEVLPKDYDKQPKRVKYVNKTRNEETINELSPELVGKVANKRFRQETGLDKAPKKAQTSTAAKTLARAAKKKWLGSNVGVLKT